MMESTVDKPDYIKEKIKLETEVFKHFSTLFLLVASGTTTIVVKALSTGYWLDYAVLTTGSVVSGVIINVLRNRYKLIGRLIDDLNREQSHGASNRESVSWVGGTSIYGRSRDMVYTRYSER